MTWTDDYRFFSAERTISLDGQRVRQLMAVHKVTGKTYWYSAAELKSNTRPASNLEIALAESLKLQSHYAVLLNGHDGGERQTFDSVDDWICRLKEIGVLHDDS